MTGNSEGRNGDLRTTLTCFQKRLEGTPRLAETNVYGAKGPASLLSAGIRWGGSPCPEGGRLSEGRVALALAVARWAVVPLLMGTGRLSDSFIEVYCLQTKAFKALAPERENNDMGRTPGKPRMYL